MRKLEMALISVNIYNAQLESALRLANSAKDQMRDEFLEANMGKSKAETELKFARDDMSNLLEAIDRAERKRKREGDD